MNYKTLVINWLIKCNEQNILPWEYDFKQEVFIQKSWSPSFNENPVKRILEKYSDFYGNPSCETEDSMLMQAVYHILWGTYSKNVIGEEKGDCDADVMNSFWVIFKYFVYNECSDFFEYEVNETKHTIKPNKKLFNHRDQENIDLLNYYKQFCAKDGDSWALLIFKNYEKSFFDKLRKNDNIQEFAKLTHTIGNFTLVPKGFNAGKHGINGTNIKHNDIHCTWSQALHKLKEVDWENKKYLDCDSWEKYFKKFYMNVYESPYSYAKAKDSKQDDFLKKINKAIKLRGMFMTKRLCEELKLEHFSFYNDLKDNKELKLFDNLDK